MAFFSAAADDGLWSDSGDDDTSTAVVAAPLRGFNTRPSLRPLLRLNVDWRSASLSDSSSASPQAASSESRSPPSDDEGSLSDATKSKKLVGPTSAGVLPAAFTTSSAAPASTRARAHSLEPVSAAKKRAVQPLLSRASMSMPWEIRNLTSEGNFAKTAR